MVWFILRPNKRKKLPLFFYTMFFYENFFESNFIPFISSYITNYNLLLFHYEHFYIPQSWVISKYTIRNSYLQILQCLIVAFQEYLSSPLKVYFGDGLNILLCEFVQFQFLHFLYWSHYFEFEYLTGQQKFVVVP